MSANIRWKFILILFILLGINTAYVINNVPPDGRWLFQSAITGVFVMTYLVLLRFIATKRLGELGGSTVVYGILNVLIFIFLAGKITAIFQTDDFLYIRFVAIMPYVVIYGLGLVLFAFVGKVIKIIIGVPHKLFLTKNRELKSLKNIGLSVAVFFYLPFTYFLYLIIWGGAIDMYHHSNFVTLNQLAESVIGFIVWCVATWALNKAVMRQIMADRRNVYIVVVPAIFFVGMLVAIALLNR